MLLKTASTEYNIRSLNDQDQDWIPSFLELCLGKSEVPASLEFWNWKHYQNPFGASLGLVGEENNRIIGLRVFLRWIWIFQGVQIAATRAVDTATHPESRGKGVFSRLTTTLLDRATREGFRFVFNTPNELSKPGYLKMGWKEVRKVPLWFRPLKPFSIVSHLMGNRSISSLNEIQHGDIEECLENMALEECAGNLNSDYRFHTPRTLSYLTWRYKDIPGFHYAARWRIASAGSALVIFRKKIRRNLMELSISELLCSSGEGVRIAGDLLTEILDNSDAHYAIAMGAEDTTEEQALKQSGFYSIPHLGPVLTVRNLGMSDPIQLLNWDNWRCSIGDFEIF